MLFALMPAQAQAPYNLSQTRSWIEPSRTPVIATESPIIAFNIRNGYITPSRNILSPVEVKIDERTEIINYISELWKNDAKTALRIFNCESGLNPKAINWNDARITGYPSWGIAQLNRPKFDGWDNWKINLDSAFELYQARGFEPWTCQ